MASSPQRKSWGVTRLVPRGTGVGALQFIYNRDAYESFDKALKRQQHRTLIPGWTPDGIHPVTLRAKTTTEVAMQPNRDKNTMSRKTIGSEVEAFCGLQPADKPPNFIPIVDYCDDRFVRRTKSYIACGNPPGNSAWARKNEPNKYEDRMDAEFVACMEGRDFPKKIYSCDLVSATGTPAQPKFSIDKLEEWQEILCKPKPTIFQTVQFFDNYELPEEVMEFLERVRKATAQTDILPMRLLKLGVLNMWALHNDDRVIDNMAQFLVYFVVNILRTVQYEMAAFPDLISFAEGCYEVDKKLWGVEPVVLGGDERGARQTLMKQLDEFGAKMKGHLLPWHLNPERLAQAPAKMRNEWDKPIMKATRNLLGDLRGFTTHNFLVYSGMDTDGDALYECRIVVHTTLSECHPDLRMEKLHDDIAEIPDDNGWHYFKPLQEGTLWLVGDEKVADDGAMPTHAAAKQQVAVTPVKRAAQDFDTAPLTRKLRRTLWDQAPAFEDHDLLVGAAGVAETYVDGQHLGLGVDVGFDARGGRIFPLKEADPFELSLQRRGKRLVSAEVPQHARDNLLQALTVLAEVFQPVPELFEKVTATKLDGHNVGDAEFGQALDSLGHSTYVYKKCVDEALEATFQFLGMSQEDRKNAGARALAPMGIAIRATHDLEQVVTHTAKQTGLEPKQPGLNHEDYLRQLLEGYWEGDVEGDIAVKKLSPRLTATETMLRLVRDQVRVAFFARALNFGLLTLFGWNVASNRRTDSFEEIWTLYKQFGALEDLLASELMQPQEASPFYRFDAPTLEEEQMANLMKPLVDEMKQVADRAEFELRHVLDPQDRTFEEQRLGRVQNRNAGD